MTAAILSVRPCCNGIEKRCHADGIEFSHLTKRTVDENGDEATQELHFFYDAQSKPAFVEFGGVKYRYIHNLQGDIIAIVDAAGNFVVEYKYDAWGRLISTIGAYVGTLGEINLFRYRGYIYDEESRLYYLQSRYYDSQVGRFTNADDEDWLDGTNGVNYGDEEDDEDNEDNGVPGLLETNAFAYCKNSIIVCRDDDGELGVSTIIGGIIGFGAGAIFLPVIANQIGLKGWKKTLFVSLGTAAITVAGGLLGRFAGKALAVLYAKAGRFAHTLNRAVAKTIARVTGASYNVAKGNGYVLKLGKYTLRIMSSGGGRYNYMRLSMEGKGTLDVFGRLTSDRARTHIGINLSNILRIVKILLSGRRR